MRQQLLPTWSRQRIRDTICECVCCVCIWWHAVVCMFVHLCAHLYQHHATAQAVSNNRRRSVLLYIIRAFRITDFAFFLFCSTFKSFSPADTIAVASTVIPHLLVLSPFLPLFCFKKLLFSIFVLFALSLLPCLCCWQFYSAYSSFGFSFAFRCKIGVFFIIGHTFVIQRCDFHIWQCFFLIFILFSKCIPFSFYLTPRSLFLFNSTFPSFSSFSHASHSRSLCFVLLLLLLLSLSVCNVKLI